MSIRTDHLSQTFVQFIEKQKVFFVATAAADGRVNVSPKGLDSLRVVHQREIVWLSVTGSGNETAAHVLQSPRMTLMFCAFEGKAMTLRVYGAAEVIHPRDNDWEQLYDLFPDFAGARNIFRLRVDLVTTACGTGVPEMKLLRSRAESDLVPWYERMGESAVADYWRRKNARSLDGIATGIVDESP